MWAGRLYIISKVTEQEGYTGRPIYSKITVQIGKCRATQCISNTTMQEGDCRVTLLV